MFHLKCVHLDVSPAEDWVCPECVLVMAAENLDTRWAFSLYLYFQWLSVFVLSFVFVFVRAADQVSSNAAAESRAVVHSSQTRARQVDLDDDDNDYGGVLL